MKNNYSPDSDAVIVEMFKYRVSILVAHMQKLIKEKWEQEYTSNKWSAATLYPILKKENQSDCQIYRFIAILEVACKILYN